MIPKIVLWGYEIDWYWLFQISGILLGIGIFYFFKNRIVNTKLSTGSLLLLALLMVLMGFWTSKIAAIIEFYLTASEVEKNNFDFIGQLFDLGGGRWYGGIVGGFFVLGIYAKLIERDWTKIWNLISISILGGFCISKLGCLFSGHGCYGVPTNLPWGMFFSYGSAPSILPVHPTPLYDVILHFVLFVLLLIYTKGFNTHFNKDIWKKILLMSLLFNFLIEIIRTNPPIVFNLSLGQIVYLLIGFVLVLSIKFDLKRENIL